MANTNEQVYDNKKGLRITFTILAYVFFIFTAVAVLPVLCPLVFGYHTYSVSDDKSGFVSEAASVVYTDKLAADVLNTNDKIAVESNDGKKVRVYYVLSNNTSDKTLTLNTKEVIGYDQVKGRIVAKTPFVGALSQLCTTIPGIILVAFIFIVAVALTIIANKMVVKNSKSNANK